jgi:hypothetical protein
MQQIKELYNAADFFHNDSTKKSTYHFRPSL